MQWREIVHEYLATGEADNLNGLLRSHERQQDRFIQQVGTDELLARLAVRHAKHLESQREEQASLPSPDQYVLVEEEDRLVIVEVERPALPKSVGTNRFRLLRDGEVWRLDEVFWMCGLCDSGLCWMCHGEVTCKTCEGTGRLKRRWRFRRPPCPLCDGSGRCVRCDGIGKCHNCVDSDMPGWKSYTEY